MFNDKHPPEMQQFFIMSIKALTDEIAKWPGMKE